MGEGIAIPARMSHLPVHGGLAVPWTVVWVDGRPDFRIPDIELAAASLYEKKCGVCGAPHDYWMVCIGGPLSMVSRQFTDPPMHEECARYSAAVCAFISGRRQAARDIDPDKLPLGMQIAINESMPAERPASMWLGWTRGYEVIVRPPFLCYRAQPFGRTEQVKEGPTIDPS